jgi:hypothetical protein
VLLTSTESAQGSPSVTFANVSGTSAVATFWIQGLQEAGSSVLTLHLPGYADFTLNVAVDPSGFVVSSSAITTNTLAANTTIYVYSERLNASTLTNTSDFEEVRGGLTVSVPLSTDDKNVLTVVTAPLSVAGGSGAANLADQLKPAGAGSTVLRLGTPAGFDTPVGNTQYGITAPVTVTAPHIQLRVNGGLYASGQTARVGNNLQVQGVVYLESAPITPQTLTVTSASGSVLVTSVEAAQGGASLTFNNVSGASAVATFWIQGPQKGGSSVVTLHMPNRGLTTYAADPRCSDESTISRCVADGVQTKESANPDIRDERCR